MRLLMKQGLAGVGFVVIGLWSAVSFAQDPAAADALSAAARETSVSGGTLMLAAYMALWLLIFGYLAMIMRRQRALSRDLSALERRMDTIFGGQND